MVRVIEDTSLTFGEYYTVLTQTEAFLNLQPLGPLNDDPTFLNALTPGQSVIVRTPSGAYKRAITKLGLLLPNEN